MNWETPQRSPASGWTSVPAELRTQTRIGGQDQRYTQAIFIHQKDKIIKKSFIVIAQNTTKFVAILKVFFSCNRHEKKNNTVQYSVITAQCNKIQYSTIQ